MENQTENCFKKIVTKKYFIKTILVFAFFLLSQNNLVAQNTSIPIMEMIFGPTATNAVVGNTGLTIGISKHGDMVNLRWPCSNYYDQLNFETPHPVAAWNKIEWYDKFLGAKKFKGSYAGIKYIQNNQSKISWFRDEEWQSIQYYLFDDAPIVCTKFTNNELGISIICTEAVLSNSDVYFRDFKLELLENNTIKNCQLVYLTSMAMCNTMIANSPNSDWADDSKNGYISYFDASKNANISFILNEKSNIFKSLPSKNNLVNFINEVQLKCNNPDFKIQKETPNLDVFCAIGSNKKIIENSLSKNNSFDLNNLNRTNNPVTGPSISFSVFSLSESQSTTIFFSLSNNYKTCIDELNLACKIPTSQLIKTTADFWNNKMSKSRIPDVPDSQMKITLKRILINTLLATNKGNGIGSSVGQTQPPYTMIWVRDAAIMGYMLDCAGFSKEAEDNVNFIAHTQRKVENSDCKKPENKECFAGTWSQCYFANGTPSWDYDFEVDEVGWGIWAMYTHGLFIEKSLQKDYFLKYEKNIILATDFLVQFKDKNGLPKSAREDDLLWKSQTILGASTTLIGLKSAIASLEVINPNHEKLKVYQERQLELENAINKEFWNEKRGEFEKAGYGNFGPRGLIIWPAQFVPANDFKMINQAKSINKQIEPFFAKNVEAMNKEWWYLGKTTTAMAYVSSENNELKSNVNQYLKQLLTEVCTQDTFVFGETPMLRKNKSGNMYYDNRVGQPSNHPAAWIYMTAELLFGKSHPELYKFK
jgi:GH15 family glucan-1,4-alpha-glucosidase